MICYAIGTQTQAGAVIFMYDKVDVEPKLLKRHKEGHYIPVKGTIQQEANDSQYL